jgi:hypothetical protein
MALINVLKEQIERNEKNIAFYRVKQKSLPKGTLHEKVINGRAYYYLKYRDENGHRVDRYIKGSDVDTIKKQILKRKEIEKIVKELREDIKLAKRALGK